MKGKTSGFSPHGHPFSPQGVTQIQETQIFVTHVFKERSIILHTTTLKELVAQLQQAELVPRLDNEEWKALIDRISLPGRIADIDEETFFYFLEVLPPKFQSGSLFAFAEGAEALRLFWQKGKQYFCRQLTWDETTAFCRSAGVAFPYWY